MKILITGCSGMLGYDLCRTLSEHELHGVDIKDSSLFSSLSSLSCLDITDSEKTYKTITKINPEIVIHTAAWTDVDGAETNQGDAYRLNAIGTKNIALACQRFDTSMIYISTDYVFDGEKKEPYVEFDKTNPQSIYGKSKYFGESIVQQLLNRFFIIRTSWLYGKNGKNFVKTILNLAKEKEELKIVNDQFGSPTYTKDLAEAIRTLLTAYCSLSTGLYGIYHITNSGSCSWYEFAKEIVKQSKVQGPRPEGAPAPLSLKRGERLAQPNWAANCKVIPVTTEEFKRPAKRPKNSVLENLTWKISGFKLLRNWDKALADYLEEI
ncbi:MAG: dTDP-4-dehydrorhamnose reductase [Elusimicrobia bacterium]|nr:dTDP-4-dehydrorhamnose reductase [Elusimicrobiota bacterium]